MNQVSIPRPDYQRVLQWLAWTRHLAETEYPHDTKLPELHDLIQNLKNAK